MIAALQGVPCWHGTMQDGSPQISPCLQRGTAERQVLQQALLGTQRNSQCEKVQMLSWILAACRGNMQVGRLHRCCSDPLPAEAQAALLKSWSCSLQARASLLSMPLPLPPSLCRGKIRCMKWLRSCSRSSCHLQKQKKLQESQQHSSLAPQ